MCQNSVWAVAALLHSQLFPSLWDLRPGDLRWSWCNNDRNKVHNTCDVLNHHKATPLPYSVHGKSSTKLVPSAKKVRYQCLRGHFLRVLTIFFGNTCCFWKKNLKRVWTLPRLQLLGSSQPPAGPHLAFSNSLNISSLIFLPAFRHLAASVSGEQTLESCFSLQSFVFLLVLS